MNDASIESELSPLDQIRQTEAHVTRQVAAARESAKLSVADMKNKAGQTINNASKVGRREGQKQYKEIVSNAEEEAQFLIAQAYKKAEHMQRRGSRCLDEGVCGAIGIIIGAEKEG